MAATIRPDTFRLHVENFDTNAGPETQALNTASAHIIATDADGACAIHAVFGSPNAKRELYCIDARQLIERLIHKPLEAIRNQVSCHANSKQALEDIETSIWEDLILPSLKTEDEAVPETNEQHIFAKHLFSDPTIQPCVVACREYYRAKKKLHKHSRYCSNMQDECSSQSIGAIYGSL